jgi:DNA topoisomerase-1
MINTVDIIKENGLIYVNDNKPGFYRKGKPGHFIYVDIDGNQLKDSNHLDRIKALVLPPAWQNVWIAKRANAYLQATGVDAANRKQYRYHPKWINRRSEHKYFRLLEFGKALPLVRKQIAKDLRRKALDEQKVLAICIDVLQKTLIRVGGKSYMQQYGTYGLSTLKDKHIKFNGNSVKLTFVGKKGVNHEITLSDQRLAKLIKKCKDIPGQDLFQFYTEGGQHKSVDSGKINEYIKQITGNDFTAKDFRTWGGTLEALRQFAICQNQESCTSKAKTEVKVLDCVAKKLGNTRAVCKSAYVYPELLEAFKNDRLDKWLKKISKADTVNDAVLENDEKVLLSFLKSVQKKSKF